MTGEQAQEIIRFHKERCMKCGNPVDKGENGTYRCECGFEWANLFIKRLPVKSFLLFKEYADKEFCSDYGMAFKSLIDKLWNESEAIVKIFEILQEHEQKISNLEGKPEKTKEIKLLSGKKIIGGREK